MELKHPRHWGAAGWVCGGVAAAGVAACALRVLRSKPPPPPQRDVVVVEAAAPAHEEEEELPSPSAAPSGAAYLGMHIINRTSKSPKHADGVLVDGVTAGGPAAEAGLRRGDELTAINGFDLAAETMAAAVSRFKRVQASLRPGDSVTLTVRRSREGETVLGPFAAGSAVRDGGKSPEWKGGDDRVTYNVLRRGNGSPKP
eukprot:TRINITY_DN1920_c0_g1_i1.p1 TRINITY_DN1920_c0_g1~~TRINITY_DN1920_c0_g1_i1.p1  ORF type:complete len:200 (+),score=67.44 TRINITY_DN1920_c0_g1_i1:65-664(+)